MNKPAQPWRPDSTRTRLSAPMRAAAAAIDKAVIQGAGTDDPLGLISTVGVGTASGGTFALSHGLTAREAVAIANADDQNIVFVAHPTTRKLLAARQRFTGVDSALWDKDMIDNRAAYVTTNCPTATLLCGDFSQITLGLWGSLVVEGTETSSAALFAAGITSVRGARHSQAGEYRRSSRCE